MSIRDSNDSAPFAGIRMPSEVLVILHRYQVSEGALSKKKILTYFFTSRLN